MFKRIVRKDGSVIILVPKNDTKAATFEVLYKVGSRQEAKNINGVSHFVEHLLFKGTKKRPNTAIISKELDGIGAEYNAFTGKDHTGYYITADSSHLPLAIDMLSDMIYNSKFDATEINRERGVIVEEINMYEDNPLMYIEDVFENLLYQGSSLGMSIAGPREIIRTVPRASLFNYYRKHYYNGNAVIGVAGKFDEKKVLAMIDKLFPLKTKKARASVNKVKAFSQSAARVDIIKRDLEQVQLMLGWRSVSNKDPKYLASQLLSNIIGGNMSSRMFIEIRERRGLCYFIRTSASGYEDIGSFTVHAGLNKDKIFEALSAIKAQLNKVRSNGVTAEELSRAKENIRGRMILKMENAADNLGFLSSQELMSQKIKDVDQKLAELQKVSRTEVNKIAKKVIQWSKVNLSIIGPFEDKNKFLTILKK